MLPGTEGWRRLEATINALPGLVAHHETLRLVLERPWPTRESLRSGLRAVADVLLPFLERRAVEAVDTQLAETLLAIQKALSITSFAPLSVQVVSPRYSSSRPTA